MGCKNIQELLKSDYLDGELGPTQEQVVREHLLKCPTCRQLESRLKAQRELIMSAKKDAPPERVWQNIRRAITAERAGEEKWLFMPRPVFALATALTAIICVIVLAGAIIRIQPFYAGNGEDILSVYTLNGETSESPSNLGTDIEEYFL